MKIMKMKLRDLKPAEYNPRINLSPGMDEYEKLKNSIIEFGFIDPPIFNKQTGCLVGGHQRVAVAKDLGLFEEIEVSVVDLPLKKEKQLNLALNKVSGQWDDEKLTALLESLDEDEIKLTGFDDDEVSELISEIDIPNFEPGTIDEQGDLTTLEPKMVICPCCGEEFNLRDVES